MGHQYRCLDAPESCDVSFFEGKSSVSSIFEATVIYEGKKDFVRIWYPAADKWSGAAARGMSRYAHDGSSSCRDSRRVGKRSNSGHCIVTLLGISYFRWNCKIFIVDHVSIDRTWSINCSTNRRKRYYDIVESEGGKFFCFLRIRQCLRQIFLRVNEWSYRSRDGTFRLRRFVLMSRSVKSWKATHSKENVISQLWELHILYENENNMKKINRLYVKHQILAWYVHIIPFMKIFATLTF